MRVKSTEIMERILYFAKDFVRDNGRSPSTTEIAEEIGVARGTAYTYLTAMRDRGMIKYDGRDIITDAIDKINHKSSSTPIIGRVVCGDPVEEESAVEEYVDLPTSIFGAGDLFMLRAYGDSMNLAGIDDGDILVVRKQQTANDGDIVIALTNNENNCKRIGFDAKNGKIILSPESSNPSHKPRKYQEVAIQGVVSHIIKKAN